jgi:hypothetical protein
MTKKHNKDKKAKASVQISTATIYGKGPSTSKGNLQDPSTGKVNLTQKFDNEFTTLTIGEQDAY